MIVACGATPRAADAVALARGDDARDVRAVAVVVVDVRARVEHVRAVYVVDEAVGVVVAAVAGDLAGVRPDRARQVGVVELHAGVEDRDEHAGSGGLRPGLRRADGGGVGERPLLLEHRVGGGGGDRGGGKPEARSDT